MKLDLSKIRMDGGTQPRTSIDEATVADYADVYAAIGEYDAMPAVDVMFDGTAYWLWDGFHRCLAATRAGRTDIDADVRNGTQRDAILASVSANARHGLRRSNADKRKAARMLLEDAEWSKWSSRAIAERTGTSHTFVDNLREELAPKKVPAKKVATVATPPADPVDPPASPTGITPPPAPLATTTATAAPAPAPGVATVATSDDADMESPEETFRSMSGDISRLQAENESLRTSDTAKEISRLHRLADHAQRERDTAMELRQKAEAREAQNMKWLRRCGKAVGEDDPAKIPAAVEAFVRAHKKVAA